MVSVIGMNTLAYASTPLDCCLPSARLAPEFLPLRLAMDVNSERQPLALYRLNGWMLLRPSRLTIGSRVECRWDPRLYGCWGPRGLSLGLRVLSVGWMVLVTRCKLPSQSLRWTVATTSLGATLASTSSHSPAGSLNRSSHVFFML